MTASSPEPFSSGYELSEEYKAVLDDTAQMASRRLTENGLYTSLNSLLLAALGIYIPVNLVNWSGPITLAIVSMVALAINAVWLRTMRLYNRSLLVRYEYLREIEEEFPQQRGIEGNTRPVGLYRRLYESKGVSRSLPGGLPQFFIILYPIATASAIVVSYLIQSGSLPPLFLK
jgi:hypothetical protein